MDWKLSLTTFATVFLAELGDKTQLATFALASDGSSRFAVFIGSAGALVLSSAVAVLSADLVSRFISQRTMNQAAAVLLIGLGIWLFLRTAGS